MDRRSFQATVWDYYKKAGRRGLPWRRIPAGKDGVRDPYRVLVSEMMLQQTQVSRVLRKYEEFLKKFPSVRALAKAPTADALKMWQGLGYNRRALNLKRAAEGVIRDFGGKFPCDADKLESLPGIGQSTRGAIMAFAFNRPTIFIETNIRSVFIHFFFRNRRGGQKIHDRDILPLIEKTLDRKNPREWYYALMDYGVYLKQTVPNPSRKSAHHAHQSKFKGSNREIRAKIVRFVLSRSGRGKSGATESEIIAHLGKTAHDVRKNIRDLIKEGFMKEKSAGSFEPAP